MATYKELLSKWEEAGRPSDVQSVHQLLLDSGLDLEQAQTAFDAVGLQAPSDTVANIDQEEVKVPDVPEWENVEIPIDYTITSNTGKDFTWKGAQWVSKGKIVPKQYKEQVTRAAKQKYYKELKDIEAEKQAQADAEARERDAEHEFSDTDTVSVSKDSTASPSSDKLLSIAKQIKSSPNADAIIDAIMGKRGPKSKVAQLAASIKANNQEELARKLIG